MRKPLFAALLLALLTRPGVAAAQDREITGTVSAAVTRQPLENATITLAGSTTVGTHTNDRGVFRLRVPQGPVTLAVRAVGYQRETRRIEAGQSTADFQLQKQIVELEGVVVTGAATTVARQNAATAVSSVSAEQVSRVPSVSLENALQGKVTGAQINMNNGAPGGGGQIQIRGVTSLLGNFQPLFVVDGTIISNSQRGSGIGTATGQLNAAEENGLNRLSDIDPNDIENVEVLKSAAASAIYGSQASNGVVIITTKRGKTGAPQFNLTQRVGTYELQRDLGMRHITDPAVALGTGAVGGDSTAAATVTAIAAANGGKLPYNDVLGNFFGRHDPSYETVVNGSGGTATTKYFASFTNRSEAGIAENTGAHKQSALVNVDQSLGAKWQLGGGAEVVHNFAQRGISNNDNSNSSPLYVLSCTLPIMDYSKRDAQGNYPINPFCAGPAVSSNPFATFNAISNNEDVYRALLNARATYNAYSSSLNNVRFSLNSGLDRLSDESYLNFPSTMQFQWQAGTGGPGLVGQGNGTNLFMNSSANAVWELTPGVGNKFTTSFGVQTESRSTNDYNIIATGIPPTQSNANSGAQTSVGQTRTDVLTNSVYGQEELLLFGERLYVSAGVRAEKSSVNGNQDKVYAYPKFAASYRFANPLPGMSAFKLRGSTGATGNQPQYGYRDPALVSYGNIAAGNGEAAGVGVPGTLGNPGIKPEQLREVEGGFDADFLGDRIVTEATYFSRTITDLLLTAALPLTSGINSVYINGGKLRTAGTELAATIVPIRTASGFTWSSRTSYYQYASKLVSLAPGVAPFAVGGAQRGFGYAYGRLLFSPGHSISTIWGNQEVFDADGNVTKVRRHVPLGDANPKYTMQFGNDFTFGRFAANVLVDYRRGGLVSNMTENLFDFGGVTWDYDNTVHTRVPSGASSVDTVMKLGDYRMMKWDGGNNTSAYLQSGSFAKLRELNVSYDVPQGVYSRLGSRVRSMRLNLAGRNLYTWTKYNGYDPEVSDGGNFLVRFIDLAPFPPTRSYFVSIDLGF